MLIEICKAAKIGLDNILATISLPRSLQFRDDPIVLLGMHRSGTTMLSQALVDLGIFMGHSFAGHKESTFFREANEWLLQVAHGNWDMPENIRYLFEQPQTQIAVERELRKQINSCRFLQYYVGLPNVRQFYNAPEFAWGWKDPRTAVTWPIWYRIFPRAKFILIYRNGVDVADSVRICEVDPSERVHSRFLSLRCGELERTFDLWEEYNTIMYEHLDNFPDIDRMELCYEDFLTNPMEIIKRVVSFIDRPVDHSRILATCEKIDGTRRYRFLDNPTLLEFYYKVNQSPLMKKFGYDNIQKIATDTVANGHKSCQY